MYALFSCALHDVDVASTQGSRVGAKTRVLRQKPGQLGNVIDQYVKRLTIYYNYIFEYVVRVHFSLHNHSKLLDILYIINLRKRVNRSFEIVLVLLLFVMVT